MSAETFAQTDTIAARQEGLENTIEAGEASVAEPRRRLVRWNEFDGPFFTLRMGAGLLYEAAAYVQDGGSRNQFDLNADAGVRDFRLLLKGRFKLDRPVTWTCGIMYDGANDAWLFRETGIMIAVPELWGHLFLGRTKEGFSLNKVMTGYAGWTMERATVNDATIPILADGIKWLGYAPNHRLLWNIGWYNDVLSEGQSFSTYSTQFITRVAWLPFLADDGGPLVHVGLNGRYGEVYKGNLQARSRPEAYLAPYFVDTGKFNAHHSRMTSVEGYYKSGPLLVGTEYFLQWVASNPAMNPFFHGGDVVITWLVTGETRSYNTVGGFFKAVSPERTVFEGGTGAWELVLRLSYVDLDDGIVQGGKFWRLTPMVNWHLSDNVRFELAYGYGTLERFGLSGTTHFFQTRLQMQI
jgi:phosphate-selective porin OprO/OprP